MTFRCVIEGEPALDLKLSGYKKVSDILFYYATKNFIQIKDENGILYLLSISRQHELWKNIKLNIDDPELFRSYVHGDLQGMYKNPSLKSNQLILEEKVLQANYDIFSESKNIDQSLPINTLENRKLSQIQVINLYKVPKNFLTNILWGKEGEFGLYLRFSEVKSLLISYMNNPENGMEYPGDNSCIRIRSNVSSTSDKQWIDYCMAIQKNNQSKPNISSSISEINSKSSDNFITTDEVDYEDFTRNMSSLLITADIHPKTQSLSQSKVTKLSNSVSLVTKIERNRSQKDSYSAKDKSMEEDDEEKEEGKSNVKSQINGEYIILKEDIFRGVLNKLTPYHAIIALSGIFLILYSLLFL